MKKRESRPEQIARAFVNNMWHDLVETPDNAGANFNKYTWDFKNLLSASIRIDCFKKPSLRLMNRAIDLAKRLWKKKLDMYEKNENASHIISHLDSDNNRL